MPAWCAGDRSHQIRHPLATPPMPPTGATVHLLDQGDMQVFGKVPLCTLPDLPRQRQRTPFIDHMDHEGDTAAPHNAPIHHQDQRLQRQMRQQDLSIRDKIYFLCNLGRSRATAQSV